MRGDEREVWSGKRAATRGTELFRSVVDVPQSTDSLSVRNLSGLASVMSSKQTAISIMKHFFLSCVVVIDYVMAPFRRLNITTTEFAALQAIMFFDPDTDGLDAASQRNVAAEQKKFLGALYGAFSSCALNLKSKL